MCLRSAAEAADVALKCLSTFMLPSFQLCSRTKKPRSQPAGKQMVFHEPTTNVLLVDNNVPPFITLELSQFEYFCGEVVPRLSWRIVEMMQEVVVICDYDPVASVVKVFTYISVLIWALQHRW